MTAAPEAVLADQESGAAAGPGPAGRGRVILRRFLSNKGSVVGAIVVVLLFLLAFLGPVISKYSYTEVDFSALREAPSAQHWFGTDRIGHDEFALVVRGLQKSLLIGLLVAFFSTVLASIVGACAGYFGGWADRVSMFFVDLLLTLPSFLIIAIMSPLFKNSSWLIFVVLLAVFGWMITARVVRSMTLSLKNQEFVRAAKFMGVHPMRIIVRHILPNVASFLIIDATVAVGGAVIAEASLSYFGFGVQPPDVSLGTLISDGTSAATTYPWLFWFSAVMLVVFVLAVNLMGDGLRDALDPTSDRVSRKQRRIAARQAAERRAKAANGATTTPNTTAGSPA
ncbi:ABC transporter permease [Mangrovactinospora gilvigrisea]|uniref:ABC transporter permease n=1 Tax=Mangrovactinospora gilvigrisea TaxID=1428644 RepID=UPI0009A10000|nr:ABC transporter permease [Mangrovactinospora gilvigrisea]